MIYTQEEHKASEREGQEEDLMNISDLGDFWSGAQRRSEKTRVFLMENEETTNEVEITSMASREPTGRPSYHQLPKEAESSSSWKTLNYYYERCSSSASGVLNLLRTHLMRIRGKGRPVGGCNRKLQRDPQ